MKNITPCLWFDDQGEDAANFYVSVFKNSKIKHVSRYTEVGQEYHGKKPGSAMVDLVRDRRPGVHGSQRRTAVQDQRSCLVSGDVRFTGRSRLLLGEVVGRAVIPNAQACGWLKDKFGVSWQVIPTKFLELLSSGDGEKAQRAMTAMFQMKKLDLPTLQNAYDG